MPTPPPLAPAATSLDGQDLPVLETRVEQDEPRSPELIDTGLKRRTILESTIFSPRSNANATTPIPTTPGDASAKPAGGAAQSKWVPLELRTPVLVATVVLLVAIAVGLEVMLKVNRDHYGWGTPSFYGAHPQIHVVWTYLPGGSKCLVNITSGARILVFAGILAFMLVRQWSEVDRYIKILQVL